MDDQTIKEIVAEIAPLLEGRSPGKIFQLTPLRLAIDFRSRDKNYLLISAEPDQPRLHMMARRVTDLEKRSLPLSPFALALKSELAHTQLLSIEKDDHDRIVRFSFRGEGELGEKNERTLIAQLTGRAANLLLLDDDEKIVRALRPGQGGGQTVGEKYETPPAATKSGTRRKTPLERGDFESLSEAADAHYRQLETMQASNTMAATARNHLRQQLRQQQKLLKTLERDLATHSNAEENKRMGDLLLGNISNAKRRGDTVEVIDYFAEGTPVVTVQVDEDSSLQDEAARRFARYAKSKRARQEITKRIGLVQTELATLLARQTELEQVISGGDEAALASFSGSSRSSGSPATPGAPASRKAAQKIPGVRRYLSSDGYEILVGRAARDNDHLTFKVAKPHDLWLHSADYPGSHVVVRNPTRKEIPHRTIVEAAQLAAYFCQARKDAKVPVHYTQRKSLAKPKGAAPGLVRMSSFKSINVEPKESGERI